MYSIVTLKCVEVEITELGKKIGGESNDDHDYDDAGIGRAR